jgi:hypothetical protein
VYDLLHIPSHLRLGLFVAVYGGVAVYQGMSVQGLSWSMGEGGAHTHTCNTRTKQLGALLLQGSIRCDHM